MKTSRNVYGPQGDGGCPKRHSWGDERLVTFLPKGLVVVVVCTLCGAVSVRQERYAQSTQGTVQ